MQIGAQMYTVRDYCKTLDDFALTLKKLADIGYKVVQVSGVCPYAPEWLKEQLDKNGLVCAITHPSDESFANAQKTVAEHKIYNCKYIGLGSLPKGAWGLENIGSFIEEYKPIAKQFRENGAYLMYHNHHFEFGCDKDGQRFFDKIVNAFPKEDLGFTLDTYWVQVGGGNPCEWLEKLSGRVPCIHLKDLTMLMIEQRMSPIGFGNMNFEKILASAEKAGTEYALVEQDYCYDDDPFECLKKSYGYLKSLGFN